MKHILIVFLLLIAVAGFSQKKQEEAKWIKLFNGKDLKDWTIKIRNHKLNENYNHTFRAEDGLLKVRYDEYDNFNEQYGHIFYKKKFSAYLLVMEYRFTGEQVKGGPGWALRNNGAMLHCQSPQSMELDQDFPISLEEQLLGGNGKDERTTGNLCTPGTNVVLNKKLFTPHCTNSNSKTFHGDVWVHAEALVLGDSVIKHIVESDTVLVYEKPQYDGKDKWVKKAGFKDGGLIKEGYISFQGESHPCDFRKIELYNLEPYMNDPKKLQQALTKLQTRKK